MISRDDVADILEQIGVLLELKGENPFKTRAYHNGAEVVRTYPGDIMQKAADEDLKGIKGIGDALAKKLHELATTGKLEYYENLRTEFPEAIFELFDIPGLGPKKVKILFEKLKIDTIARLKEACEAGEVAKLPGFGKKSEEKILAGIAFREQNAEYFRFGDVAAQAEEILEMLKAHPACSRAEVAGSFRRGKEIVHDLDFLVATREPEVMMDAFIHLPPVADVLAHGKTKSSVHLKSGVQCDLRAVKNEEYPYALVYFTGSKEHNVVLRGRALKLGYSLNEYRLTPTDDSPDNEPPDDLHEEKDLYEFLGLDYIPPAIRENMGEIEAAEEGELPRLIELENLRGTFHNHTTASDGRATLREMAEAARELGLQYLGIADHSKASFQANGLDETRLRQQLKEIAELNKEYEPGRFRVFAGSEVDIHKDGSLDFPDELLAELDYAVASVHNVFNLPEAEMTRRIIKAIENPNITMLGHLTGRLLLQRDPYPVDIPAVIEACADTGTIIELNANPWRLDMDWRWWKLAKTKGVLCAINPDAHSTRGLQDLYFGVKIAQKGWLTRGDVVNCLPLGKVERVLGAKSLLKNV